LIRKFQGKASHSLDALVVSAYLLGIRVRLTPNPTYPTKNPYPVTSMHRSILDTDGYKFSMAEAGWPLRTETFYYSHRRGGPHYLPFDVKSTVMDMLPGAVEAWEVDYLADNGYQMGGGFLEAVRGQVEIKALPKGSWFFDREPVFTVTGPSALVSWLEPLVLQLHYRIQVATIAKLTPEKLPQLLERVTCEEQRDIVLETLATVGVKAPKIRVVEDLYRAQVNTRVAELIEIVEDPKRVFEVGMRAASCPEQHRIALEAAQRAGLLATSNVGEARCLGLKPVGTMGHEHVQRYGDDATAFRAMRDRFPGASSFLLDTFDTIRSGIPNAFDLIEEDPTRRDTIRFDSGDKRSQYLIACSLAAKRGITPRFILEDSFNAEKTRQFEELRGLMGVSAEDQLYGYGGYIVKFQADPLTRDRVAAVYKLTQTGNTPTMKFGDEPGAGKESIPGKPFLVRPRLGSADYRGPNGIVYQEGEEIPDSAYNLMDEEDIPPPLRFSVEEALQFATSNRPAYSAGTTALVGDLYAARARHIKGV